MKVKLKGELFEYPMERNHVSIHDDVVEVHCYSGEVGYIKKFKNPTIVPETIEFTLNKKDFALIKTSKEFYIEKVGDTINVIADNFKAKFADMKIDMVRPALDGMEDINVPYGAVLHGTKFAGKPDDAKIQYDGVTILNDRIIASDSKCIYQRNFANDGKQINIPREIFKFLGNGNYQIMTNGKLAMFMKDNGAFYTRLVATLLSSMKLDENSIVQITVNKEDLLEKLKIIKEYANVCHLSASDEMMKMDVKSEGNELSFSTIIKPVKLSKLEYNVNVSNVLRMVSLVEDEEVSILFDKNMVKVVWDNIITASGRVSDDHFPELEVEA